MPTYIVLLGPPGAGKGTQARRMSETLGFAHVSSGDLFRDQIQRGTELGRRVEPILKSGGLVPDDVTIAIVEDRIGRPDCARGVIFDGFPRTRNQAAALDEMLARRGGSVNAAPLIKVDEAVMVDRLGGRLTCKGPGQHMYHPKYSPPKTPGVCDVDGTELYQRDDDRPDTVRTRFQQYVTKTAPLVEYYRERGVLVEVNGEQAIEAVTRDLMDAVGPAVA